MPEQIIDIRERIEKMRIKFEDDKKTSFSATRDLENQTKKINSNEENVIKQTKNENKIINEKYNNFNNLEKKEIMTDKETNFPSVSLSVKNPISSKILVILMLLQVFSNIGIFVLLYKVLE